MVGFLDVLSGAGKIASAVGAISPLFGGGNDDAGTGKIATRPMEENIADIEKLRAYLAAQRRTIQAPTRRLTAAEMADDTFAPKAVMALQRALDEKRAAQPQQPTGTQTDDMTKKPTQDANAAAKARAIQALRMAAVGNAQDFASGKFRTPATEQANEVLRLLPILEGMDGYKNEYTGTTFSLPNYLQGVGDYFDELNSGGVNQGLVSTQMSDRARKAQDLYSTERWNALKRPPERDLIAPLAAAAIMGIPAAAGVAGGFAPAWLGKAASTGMDLFRKGTGN